MDNNILTLSTNEISELLGLKPSTFKKIKALGELEGRLKNIGFTLQREYKQGRNIIYEIALINYSMTLGEVYRDIFNVKHPSFGDYYQTRTSTAHEINSAEEIISKNDIAKKCGCKRQTISEWDDKLIDLGIMESNGYVYVRVYECSAELTTHEDYKNYQANLLAYKDNHRNAVRDYAKGNISKRQLDLLNSDYSTYMDSIKFNYVIRVKAFKLNESNPIHKAVISLINEEIEKRGGI